MYHRPINTLEEDFRLLGVVTEEIDTEEAEVDEASVFDFKARQRMLAKQARGGDRNAAMKLRRNKAAQRKAKASLQAMRRSQYKKTADMGPEMEDVDLDIDFDDDDGDTLDERLVKRRRQRGVKAIKSRKLAKRYYKTHKAAIKRLKKTAKYKRRRAKLAKMKKGPKGYIRMLNMSQEYDLAPMIESLGNIVDALGHDNRAQQFSTTYSNIARLATATGKQYLGLAEEYLSTNVNFLEIVEACRYIAEEANEWAEALSEHDVENEGEIATADQELMQEHIQTLVGELDNLVDMHDDLRTVIDIDEGLDDDDEEGDELEEAAAFLPSLPPQQYGEGPLGVGYGWKNADVHQIGNVMHPLGLQAGLRRMSNEERERMAEQLQALGYGEHLGMTL